MICSMMEKIGPPRRLGNSIPLRVTDLTDETFRILEIDRTHGDRRFRRAYSSSLPSTEGCRTGHPRAIELGIPYEGVGNRHPAREPALGACNGKCT